MNSEIQELKHRANIVDIVSKRISLQKKSGEFYGICPFHNDTKSSLQVNERKQIFKCFACGKGGDVFDFLTGYGMSLPDAIRELNGDATISSLTPEQVEVQKKKRQAATWTQIPASYLPTEIKHYQHGTPSLIWTYKDAAGNVIGYICRFDFEGGRKEVVPFVFATNGAFQEWRWLGFATPRPLYNLDRIAANPNAQIIIVEGEKAADAASVLFPRSVVTCWIGGGKAVQHTDWTPIVNRDVILWADNDEPGFDTMNEIASVLGPTNKRIRFVKNPEDAPKGWDIADARWNSDEAFEYVKNNVFSDPQRPTVVQQGKSEKPEEIKKIIPPPIPEIPKKKAAEFRREAPYFKMLGYEKTDGTQIFCFFVKASNVIVKLTASSFSKNNLITLAPLNFWEGQFGGNGGRAAFNIDHAVSWLIAESNEIGIFTGKNVRGRGAWVDGKSIVVHSGDHLIVDGVSRDLNEADTKFVYEASEAMGFNTDNPLNTREASQLIELCERLNWERSISSYLLAGWCVIAPICGALKWRPHIWITGPAGTGKTWVFQKIVRRCLGETSVTVQGETSEAGLRQLLNQDALPVVFDEADVDDRQSVERVQKVLTLMRSASAEDGGMLAKGTAGGTAKTFRIRTCFAFASIGVQVHNQADRSRVSILSLIKKDGDGGREKFQELLNFYDDIFNDEYMQRLQARTISMLPIILKNAETFSNAAAAVIGDQRAGDQLGAMLAGAYSLKSTGLITYVNALAWIQARDWSEEQGSNETKDEHALFSKLMDELVRVDGVIERNIGELIQISAGYKNDPSLTIESAAFKLNRIGIKIESNYILISNNSEEIKRILKDTSWAKNYGRVLLRLLEAEQAADIRFGSGMKHRATAIPLNYLIN